MDSKPKRPVVIRAKIADEHFENVCKMAEELSGGPPRLTNEGDEFYEVTDGRLRLRTYKDFSGALIWNNLTDQHEHSPKLSNQLSIYETIDFPPEKKDDFAILQGMLAKHLKWLGQVEKKRKRFMVGQSRIDIDSIKNLGHYVKISVVPQGDSQTHAQRQDLAYLLLSQLGVKNEDRINKSYLDLVPSNYNFYLSLTTATESLSLK